MSLDFIRETAQFQQLLRAVKQGKKGLYLSGVTEAAKPYFLAALMRDSGRKVIFVRPPDSSLSNFEDRCRYFLSAFAADLNISRLPSLAENPYQEVAPSLESVSSRMEFFYGLVNELPSLIVTNLFGLMKPFLRVNDLKQLFLSLEKGASLSREYLLQKFSQYGYEKEDIINSHGEYAWRGGIVDVFSPWQTYPSRIEFKGDEILSIREFDYSSQRSIRRVERIVVPSIREFPGGMEFLQTWLKLARKKAGASCLQDLKKKTERLQTGDVFPDFAFQALALKEHFTPFTQYLSDYLIVIDEFEKTEGEWEKTLKELKRQYNELKAADRFVLPPEEIFPFQLWDKVKHDALRLSELASSSTAEKLHFAFQSVPRFGNKMPFFFKYLKKLQKERDRCLIFFSHKGVREKLAVLLDQQQISNRMLEDPMSSFKGPVAGLLIGDIEQGFSYPDLKIICFAENDIITEARVLVSRPRVRTFLSHFRDLKAGDHIVHADYGIGIFSGLVKLEVDEKKQEFIRLIYKDDDKLFVPVADLNLVQKYSRLGTFLPILSKLGTTNWEKTKARTKKSIESMAKELLALYALRKAKKGFKFSQHGEWQSDFENTFEYKETEDQLKAIKDIMLDMESETPMDRLLCGDVGYGKTEVAVRAAFKAVMDGKQVAVLCPTTVLASQHLKTFRDRMLLFPVKIQGLSRLQSPNQQKKVLEEVRKGRADIIIGTHRLLSRDVRFSQLGLLIIDEEQRFGVKHKEKIKQLKINIDVMTMTATPIPRTLNLSLSGLRDISLIESPPKDRLAIHTVVTPFNRKLISSVIQKELSRFGQVYFIHNRVEDIETIAHMLEKWVPEAKIVITHGQMSPRVLEKRMIDFINGKYNVLVSTTIIENGIDIPLVNALIVNRADKFGLSQLYQLRGRVGRSSRQAVAYFLVPSLTELTPKARDRLKALREFSALGSGFRLAAKDLEIRGAGNFLGSQQHGYMEAVGFDYYLHLLDGAIKRLNGEESEEVKSELNLKVSIQIPDDYIPQINLRLDLYKRVSSIEGLDELERIKEEAQDRNGPLPASVKNLFLYGAAKFLARRVKIKRIDRLGRKIVFQFLPDSTAYLKGLPRLLERYSGSITPQGIMSLYLSSKGEAEVLNETILILKELSLM